MFRKIISNLPFSPALVGQIGLYSKRLRKEKITRRLGLIFVILALLVQSFAVFQSPESTSALNKSDTASEELEISENQSLNSKIIRSVTATDASQGFVDASSVTAYAGDQISYTITIHNTDINPISVKPTESLLDLLDYSTLIDNGGGTLDTTTKILSWPDVTLAPNTKQTRTFAIRLLDTIPTTAQDINNTKSYDCIMTNTFGNSIDVRVDCPVIKVVEQIVAGLPSTGTTENIIFASIILATATYLYARTRQLEKEVRLIRKDISTGTI